MSIRKVMERYRVLLKSLDMKYRQIRNKYSSGMLCGMGCCRCCHGLFDVSAPDAVRTAAAFSGLSEKSRTAIAAKAALIQESLLEMKPGLATPFFLTGFSDDAIDLVAECFAEARCPFLDRSDFCLIYDERPLACILEGIPMVDFRDGLFGDWCELNFREGISPELSSDVTLDYYGMRDVERQTTVELLQYMPGHFGEDATVFIPSIICSFDSYWKSCLE